MKGMNTLRLNQATIIDALEEYLSKRLTTSAGKQKVLSVSYAPPTGVGNGEFIVRIEEKKDVR
jgi:hypothetical protein